MATTSTPNILTEELQQHETAASMTSIVWQQFRQHRLAVVGGIIITLLVLTALGADLISKLSGLDPDAQNVSARYLEPMTRAVAPADARESAMERWVNANPETAKGLNAALFAKQIGAREDDALFDLVATKETPEALAIVKQLEKDGVSGAKDIRDMIKSFDTFHLFGTDEIGRDVFIRLIYGSRVSLGVGVLVALISALIGFLVGSLAGFYGGAIDTILMRVTDALLSLPTMPVLIVFAAIDLTKLPVLQAIIGGSSESIFKMVIVICLFSWMTVARLVRGSILSLREREFVLAARTLGARDRTIIARHMFPNVIAPMLVSITLGVGDSILFEASLSFLGLGIMPPTASWGNMLNNAQEVIYKNMWLTVLPGLLILITVVSFNFFGDGLQDAMDPKSVRR